MTPLVKRAAELGAAFSNSMGVDPLRGRVTAEDVFRPTKRQEIARAKHAAWAYMYSLRRPCGKPRVSLLTIGRVTALAGGQATPFDHTSVMYGIRRHKQRDPMGYALMYGETLELDLEGAQ